MAIASIKGPGPGRGKTLDQNDPINAHKLPTAEKLAQEHGVTEKTIKGKTRSGDQNDPHLKTAEKLT